jgi:hypothetical protein
MATSVPGWQVATQAVRPADAAEEQNATQQHQHKGDDHGDFHPARCSVRRL